DLDPTMAELRRVLVDGGWCVAFWNLRTEAGDFGGAYDQLLRKWSPEYDGLDHKGIDARLREHPAVANRRELDHPFLEEIGWERLHGRIHSASYVAHGVADLEGFDRELRALFDASARNDVLALPQHCVALAWQFR